jgi:hypothetical protein
MNEFRKYMHVERLGTDEVDGIEFGECYVFPKIDGTCSSIWLDSYGYIKAGSRRRELTLDNDNAGFYQHVLSNDKYKKLLQEYPNWILYGEFLVPHTLKTYRDDAWRKFYVFDVWDSLSEKYVHYNEYVDVMGEYSIECVPAIAVTLNPKTETFLSILEKNTFLIKQDNGFGEGIVIKNYSFKNKYGRTVWAKIVTSEFKDKHVREMGTPKVCSKRVTEEDIVDKYVTGSFIDKEFNKIVTERGGWKSQYISQLLGRCYHALVTEEIWNIVKEYKNPKIDFGYLNGLLIATIKRYKSELF